MIVNSSIVEDSAQPDGRRFIRERHTDHLGATYDVVYLCLSGDDAAAFMAARVARIENDLDDQELNQNVQRAYEQISPTFNHTTVAKFRSRLRAAFRDARGWQLVLLGKFVHGLNLSDNVLKNLFGVNDAQLVVLRAKLQSLADKYADVIAQAGD